MTRPMPYVVAVVMVKKFQKRSRFSSSRSSSTSSYNTLHTYIHEAVFPHSEISRFRPDFVDIFTSVMRGCVSHLCLYFVSAPATDGLAEATDAPGVVRFSRGWRREQVGRAQCTRRSRSGCCSSRGVSNVFMYGDETGLGSLTRVWRQRGCPRNE